MNHASYQVPCILPAKEHRAVLGSKGRGSGTTWATSSAGDLPPGSSDIPGDTPGSRGRDLKVCHGFAADGEYPFPSLTLLLKL